MAGMVAARIQGGYAQFYRGDYHTAKLYLNEARALAQELGQPSQQAHALAGLGATYGQTGQYGEALKCQLESLRLVQGLSDRRVESRALNAVGQLYINLRDYDQAVRYHTDAYDLACEEGAVMLELSAAINLAVAYLHSGNASRALSLNEDVLARIAGQELHQMEAVVRGNLAATLEQLGRLDEALTACEEALRMALQLGLMDARCDNLIIRATVLGQLGRYPEAITDLQLALQMAARLDSRQREREAYREMARVLEAMGNAQGALGALQRFYRLETEALTVISQERTKVLALQLQLDRLEHRAAEQELRNEELAAIKPICRRPATSWPIMRRTIVSRACSTAPRWNGCWNWPVPSSPPSLGPCCLLTWTTLSRLMILWGTRWGTSCCGRWPSGYAAASAPMTWWRAREATNLPCCCVG